MFFESNGWLPICGHSIIGVCTVLVEQGLIPIVEPITNIVLDTPLGLINAKVTIHNGKATNVSFKNVPSFVINSHLTIETEEWGTVLFDIAWGGYAIAIIPASYFKLEINTHNTKKFEAITRKLLPVIQNNYPICHPLLPDIHFISHIEYVSDDNSDYMKNIVINPSFLTDRSPCGNGTSARAAQLHEYGQLNVGESFTQYSAIGSSFTCTCTEESLQNGIITIIPEISGKAWITSMSTFVASNEDPFRDGFLLG